MSKRAIIVGANGQDGTLLTSLLGKKGYEISKVTRENFNIADPQQVSLLTKNIKPTEVYFLAAVNFSSEEHHENQMELLRRSYETSTISLGYFYQAALDQGLDCAFFNASSSLIFKPSSGQMLNETSERIPSSIYSSAKISAMDIGRYFINEHGLKIFNGILFNHESIHRGDHYLSKKIIKAACAIKRGQSDSLELNSLESIVDWSAAEDFTSGMHLLLNSDAPSGDYIFASGQGHSVKDFVQIAFDYLDLDFNKYLKVNSTQLFRKSYERVGNSGKLTSATNWKRELTFEKMIQNMIDHELANEP